MAGYPLGSPGLREHVHEVVQFALWPVHKGILHRTGYVIPTAITDLAPAEYWGDWRPDR